MGQPSPSQPGRVVTTEGLTVSGGCPPPLQDGLTPHPHCVQGTFTITFMELLADKSSGFGPLVLKSSNQYDMFVQIHSALPGLTVIHLTLKELLFIQSSRSQRCSSKLSQTKCCPPLPLPPVLCTVVYSVSRSGTRQEKRPPTTLLWILSYFIQCHLSSATTVHGLLKISLTF